MTRFQNRENYERMVIAGCMQDSDNFFKAKSKGITKEEFETPQFQDLWSVLDQYALSDGISPLIVSEKMKHLLPDQREAYRVYLEQLKNENLPAVDFDFSLNKLKEFTGIRALLRLSSEIQDSVDTGDEVESILSKVTSSLFSINTNSENIQEFNAFEAVEETSKELKKRLEGDISDGVPSGIETLDNEIRCFFYGLATIVIGRPGHGKTTLMVNTFVNNLKSDYKPLFVSLEMPAIHIVLKMLAIMTKIEMRKIFDPRLMNEQDKVKIKQALFYLSQKEFYIVDAVSMTVTEMGMILLKYAKLGCKVSYLDYIQLLKMPNGQIPNDAGEFRAVFKEVREILRRVNRYGEMASVLGAQAGRSVETRPVEERIPQMKDLEWSSSLEQDAAVIIGVMNPEKYEGEECQHKNQLFLGFPKHRYENAVRVNLAFLGNIQYITDLATPERVENIPQGWLEQVEREDRMREEEANRLAQQNQESETTSSPV